MTRTKYTMIGRRARTVGFAALFLIAGKLMAQQDPYFTHYNFVRPLYNPAAIGLDGKWCAFGINHNQYMGLQDRTPVYSTPNNPALGEAGVVRGVGPKTNGVGVSVPLNKFNKQTQEVSNFGGVGLVVYNDRIGYETNNLVKGQFAYRMNVGLDGTLAFGVDVGYLQKGLDGAKLRAIHPGDPFIPTNKETDGGLTAAFGAFYTNKSLNNLHVGLSSTNLVPAEYRFGDNGSVYSKTARHYYALAGMEIPNFMGNPELTLLPSALIKYNAKVQIDGTAIVEYMDQISGGLGYRSITDALSVMMGYKFEGIRVGLSYDITLSRLNQVSRGTFELCLNYCWEVVPKTPPPPYGLLTPRVIDREMGSE
jgi:type IX secretion system PorP/SprF family membrane protein